MRDTPAPGFIGHYFHLLLVAVTDLIYTGMQPLSLAIQRQARLIGTLCISLPVSFGLLLTLGVPVQAETLTVAASVQLTDENGQPATLDEYRQYLRLVFFGYTRCPDICPLTMYFVGNALRSLGAEAARVRVLFITIDPNYDTPAVLAQYTDAFHPAIIGLTGSYDKLMTVTEEFSTTFGYTITEDGQERPVSGREYTTLSADAPYVPYHGSQIYLLDGRDRIVDVIGYGSDAADIAARIHQHLANDSQDARDRSNP